MPHSRRLRSTISVLAAVAAVAGLTLTAPGAAQAVTGPAERPPRTTAPSKAAAKPDPRVDRVQKDAQAHYTNAPCNRAEKDYLEKHLARCFSVVRTALDHQITPAADPPPTALGPADIQDAYHLPDSGDGEVVGIVDAFGDSHAEADLAQFRSFYGLPPCTVANGCLTIVNQDGDTSPLPPDDPGWGLETSLDLDAVSAACPNCNILLVQGDDNSLDNLGIAVDTAVSLGAKFVSNSYGVPGEDPGETDFDHYYDHPGVAVTASTGDIGNVTNWPASSPKVVAVGGTTLTADTSPRGWTESRVGRRRQRLLAVRAEARLPAGPGHQLRQARDRRHLRRRRPGDRPRGLRHPRRGRLAPGRRYQPLVAAHGGDVRAGRRPGRGHLPQLLPVRRPR